jgi:UDP-glucose 4-epimerase
VLEEIMDGFDRVFHIAANADVRGGWSNHRIDLDQNIIATSNVAEAARRSGVKEVIFASTGCVYGDSTIIPTSENEPFPIQTSLYGSSKVAAEGILSSYAAQGAFNVTVFRFVSVLGQNYHHGHVVDFVRKLRANPRELAVLGNGTQRKSYIHVEDCVQALIELRNLNSPFEVFNIGHDYFIPVHESANLVVKSMGLSPKIVFGTADRGWIGDNPFTFLDISKAKSFGWTPTISIEESVEQTVQYLLENEWVLSRE